MDKYTVVGLVGVGSYGRVYKANKKADNKIVAIKIISKRGRSNKEISNFRQECKIQSKLKNANIIEMFESFETKNELYVVTEFYPIDLHKFLSQNGSINEEQAQYLTTQLISALYYLHSQRVLHRDLKPQNVLLNDSLHAKLCDFGLARIMNMSTHVLTSIKGTPLYMAPELLAEKPYDHGADLWSLGCIIYETLVGQTPFFTTSIFHLVRLIKNEEVKWPSFIGNDCTSFLQGLLEKNRSLRMTWAQILCHPFVEGKLTIPKDAKSKKFLKSITNRAKNTQTNKKGCSKSEIKSLCNDLGALSISKSQDEATVSSSDSVNAVLQSDVENIETDVEVLSNQINIPFSEPVPEYTPNICEPSEGLENKSVFVSGNSNLIVVHLNENIEAEIKSENNTGAKKKIKPNNKNGKKSGKKSKNKELEKRKLSQNLDNFSMRLGQSLDEENCKKIDDSVDIKKSKLLISNDEKATNSENTPPCLLPGWDSCDESQSPPIENDEWLAFLHRSMQEILDGELDSLQQQNLVSIIVAPLRNTKASSEVIESVAKLLSFPLVLGGPPDALDSIKNIYVDVKLVPNLMYASKLLTGIKSTDSNSSPCLVASNIRNFKYLTELTLHEIKTLNNLYELVCHLVHLNERFLLQFCDAVAILAADELLINFLCHDFKGMDATRISINTISLFCCVLRELPENAELVENIIFNEKLNLIALINNPDSVLKSRICMLFRLLGRFSSRKLQNIWSETIRQALEKLLDDNNDEVRLEAQDAISELKHFSFYC